MGTVTDEHGSDEHGSDHRTDHADANTFIHTTLIQGGPR